MAADKAGDDASRVRFVTLSQVQALLQREQESREDLTYEQKLALDHADHFVKLQPERSEALVSQLLGLGGRVTEYYAHRIADLLPTHPDDVKAIFARDRSVPDENEIEKILAAVRDYV